ncbi:hypothetical protein I302_101087 [Kwoniella bestiolae CBS 10118]|uniref:Methyltransferase domain-containing protein n=1 Tax=Kwoniella bestiolae CBS 10118 TaxID=1296100 RepID=A0A1B9G6V5_9TREE|nr:hypothetical protein I302_04463 [Kwoniella bestiolae CBS 10118]OCF26774.1 hypothetical protein I302_04463 [Kwoniella bestiolae CBS 10118]
MSKRPTSPHADDEQRGKPKPRAKSYGLGLMLRGHDNQDSESSSAVTQQGEGEEAINVDDQGTGTGTVADDDTTKSPPPNWLPTLPVQKDKPTLPFLGSQSQSHPHPRPYSSQQPQQQQQQQSIAMTLGGTTPAHPLSPTPSSTENSTLPPLTPQTQYAPMGGVGSGSQGPPSPTGSSFTFTSSMQHAVFREDEGRLYNAIQDDYALPADTEEIQRLDIQHHAIRILFGGNYLPHVGEFLRTHSPLGKNMRVLDLGCGTGTWCLEMAREFPEAEFIGIDLVPIQPDTLPDNCSFAMDDITKGLPYPDGTFDLVTGRLLVMGLRDYPSLLVDIARVIKPGGMYVATEPDINLILPEGQSQRELKGWNRWENGLQKAMLNRGTDPQLAPKLPQYFTDSGLFQQVDSVALDWPLTPWSQDPKQRSVGSVMIRDVKQFPDTSRLLIIDGAGISPTEYDGIKIRFLQEIEMDWKIVWKLWAVWGIRLA